MENFFGPFIIFLGIGIYLGIRYGIKKIFYTEAYKQKLQEKEEKDRIFRENHPLTSIQKLRNSAYIILLYLFPIIAFFNILFWMNTTYPNTEMGGEGWLAVMFLWGYPIHIAIVSLILKHYKRKNYIGLYKVIIVMIFLYLIYPLSLF